MPGNRIQFKCVLRPGECQQAKAAQKHGVKTFEIATAGWLAVTVSHRPTNVWVKW